MTTGFIETIKQTPVDAIAKEASTPLSLTKTYLDSVIQNYKSIDQSNKVAIDELTVDGLDANQVWWQTKMVIDSIEGDLLERIQDLKEAINVSVEESFDESESDINNGETFDEVDSENDVPSNDDDEQVSEEEEENSNADIPVVAEDDESDIEQEKIDNHEDEEDDDEESEEENDIDETPKEKDPNDVNDEFFNIEEFNKQTLAQEDNLDEPDNDDGEEIDYFADFPSDEDEEADYFEDFYDKPNSKQSDISKPKSSKKKNDTEKASSDSAVNSLKLDLFEEADDFEDEDIETVSKNGKKLSTFEKQQLEIQKQITQLEAEAVAEKKWALKGEVKAKDRPEDALLTEDLEFERTAKPVPVITSDVTESLEEMIRKRIQEYNFDDLARRTVNDFTKRGPRPQFELSDVKSSKSLAEIYADDYQGVSEETVISEELQKSHDEITELFNDISYKLDALSSAHFIPKPAQKSLEVRVETSAIAMEDAQPLSMSSGSTLAPQEVYKVGKADNVNEIRLNNGTVMSREELTREDKNRLRRSIKRKRAKNQARQQLKPNKKSKKDDVIETLSRAKNITVINKQGEKHDVKGNTKSAASNNNVNNLRL